MALSIPSVHGTLNVVDLRADFGPDFERLPWVLRILLENVARKDAAQLASTIAALKSWLEAGTSEAEIAFHPSRVLMHDTTCVPALVDIAAMRDAIAEAGGDPDALSPVLPVDVSIDHSVAVDRYGQPDARRFNMQREMDRNSERYRLMKWATQALPGVKVHPREPGSCIRSTSSNLQR